MQEKFFMLVFLVLSATVRVCGKFVTSQMYDKFTICREVDDIVLNRTWMRNALKLMLEKTILQSSKMFIVVVNGCSFIGIIDHALIISRIFIFIMEAPNIHYPQTTSMEEFVKNQEEKMSLEGMVDSMV
jgi:hypothetical protein